MDNPATPTVEAFFAACTSGDLSALRIVDPNGVHLMFAQPVKRVEA